MATTSPIVIPHQPTFGQQVLAGAGAGLLQGFTQERENIARKAKIQPILTQMIDTHPQLSALPPEQKRPLIEAYTNAFADPRSAQLANITFGNLTEGLESQAKLDEATSVRAVKEQQAEALRQQEIDVTSQVGGIARQQLPEMFGEGGDLGHLSDEQVGTLMQDMPASIRNDLFDTPDQELKTLERDLRKLQLEGGLASAKEKKAAPERNVLKARGDRVSEQLSIVKDLIDHGAQEFKSGDFADTVSRLFGKSVPALTEEEGSLARRNAVATRLLIDEFTRLTEQAADLKLREATAGLTDEERKRLLEKTGEPEKTKQSEGLFGGSKAQELNEAIQKAIRENQ